MQKYLLSRFLLALGGVTCAALPVKGVAGAPPATGLPVTDARGALDYESHVMPFAAPASLGAPASVVEMSGRHEHYVPYLRANNLSRNNFGIYGFEPSAGTAEPQWDVINQGAVDGSAQLRANFGGVFKDGSYHCLGGTDYGGTMFIMRYTEWDASTWECKRIVELDVPDSVTEVGTSCFEYMASLKDLHVGDGVRVLPRSALSCDNALVDLYLRRFYCVPHVRAITLTEFDLHPDCMVVEPSSLDDLWQVSSLSFLGRICHIGARAAAGCLKLEKVTLGPAVSYIGAGAFMPHNLKEVECMPYMLDDVDASAFLNGTLAESGTLYVPEGTTYFYMLQPWVYDEDRHFQVFANVVEKQFAGIDALPASTDAEDCVWYSVEGMKLSSPVRGINICVSPDGTARKVLVP